jgi:hypothetical protein
VKRRDLPNHLHEHGCQFIREGSRHTWFGNPANRKRSAIPRHKEIDSFLARKICRDLGIAETAEK